MLTTLNACILLALGAVTASAQEKASPVYYFNPAWSPDSRSLLFESTKDRKFAIYTIGIDGSGLRKLTSGAANDEQPSWSPDGQHIVFASDRDGHGQLYRMRADGSNQTRLTNTASGGHFFASFSPDGQGVVFQVQPVPKGSVYLVYVVRADGSGMRALTDTTRSSEGPRWSADGKQITFTRVPLMRPEPNEPIRDFVKRRDRASEVVAMNRDGTKVHVIDPSTVRDPEVSPDGRWRASTKQVDGAYGVYVTEIATGRERLLTGGPPR